MPATLDSNLTERLKCVVDRNTGLALAPGKSEQFFEHVQLRAATCRLSIDEYVTRLERAEVRAELRELAPFLTVCETFFFRNPPQLEACCALMVGRAAADARPLRILSAGCASGEEAYSLAIALRRAIAGAQQRLKIVGFDLNPRVLARAKQGRYSEWSLRALEPDFRAHWFRQQGSEWLLDASIREAVEFTEGNLVQPDGSLLPEQSYDVIFCRNVLMYFSPDKCRQAIAHLTRALVPSGHLFLGHAETLRGLSQDYHLCHTHDAFYYQRKPSGEVSQQRWRFEAAPEPLPTADSGSTDAVVDSEWFASIDRASARVSVLGARSQARSTFEETPKPRDLKPVLELMRDDRHSEALELISSTASTDAADPERLLLEATLLAHANRFVAAEAACRRLLQLDELNSGAHYVLALCREASGELERALYHDQVAAYLDPAFAMPHVHMGVLLRRHGRREAAQRELAEARALLEREESARVSMFGGGFGRAALLAMCAPDSGASGEAS